ncbi:unnamed protein product, partial [Iphiclides podalirius]
MLYRALPLPMRRTSRGDISKRYIDRRRQTIESVATCLATGRFLLYESRPLFHNTFAIRALVRPTAELTRLNPFQAHAAALLT